MVLSLVFLDAVSAKWEDVHRSLHTVANESLVVVCCNLSTHHMVSETTPPTLLLLCHDDALVSSEDAAKYYEQLVAHGVKASMHIFPFGGHSVKKHTAEYEPLVLDWLRYLGFIDEK